MTEGVDHIGIAVVFFCHDGKGSFVMARRSAGARNEHGKWDIGGGAVEFDEPIEDALKREVYEEYGATITSAEFLGFRDVHFTNGRGTPEHWIALDWKVLVDPTTVKNNEPEKINEVQWATFRSLPDPLHFKVPEFLEKYRDRLA